MRRNRESRARIRLIQEMQLDKRGQRVIDVIHRDIGTSYVDLYASFRTAKGFRYAMRTILDGMRALGKSAARIIGGNYAYGAHAGTFRVNAMRVEPRDVYINADVYPKIPPMEVNVQIMEEATP